MKVTMPYRSILLQRYLNIGLLALLCLVGLYLRLYGIIEAPILEDEAATSLQTLGIMKTRVPTLPSGHIQWGEPPLIAYLAASLWIFTGVNIFYARLISVLISTLSIVMGYVIGREVNDNRLGFMVAFLLATNLWSIGWGRSFRSYSMAELGFLIFIAFSVKAVRSHDARRRYLLLFIESIIVTLLFHYLLFLLAIVLISYLIILAWITEFKKHVKLKITLPRRGHLQNLNISIKFSKKPTILLLVLGIVIVVGSWVLLLNSAPLVQIIGTVTGEFFVKLRQQSIRFHFFYVSALWEFYGPFLFLAFAGFPLLVIRKPRIGSFLLLSFVIPFFLLSSVFASLAITTPYRRYLMPFNAALLISLAFFSLCLADVLSAMLLRIRNFPFPNLNKVLFLVVMGMILILASHGFTLTFNLSHVTRDIRDEPVTPNYDTVYDFIASHSSMDDAILTTKTDVAYFFLAGRPIYWLMSNPLEISEGGRIKDGKMTHYITGCQLISNLSDFIEVMKAHRNGWVIIPWFHEGPWSIDEELLSFIKANLELEQAASDQTIKVYRWTAISINLRTSPSS